MILSNCSSLAIAPTLVAGSSGSPTGTVLARSTTRSMKLVGDRALDEQPAAAVAALAHVEVDAVDDGVERRLEVGVREDELRVLAAELELHLLEVALGGLDHPPADLRRTREGEHVHVGVLGQAGTDDATRARDDVQDARPAGRRPGQISARRIVVPGVSSAGFTTAVQPTARANGSFWLMISSGKFQGVIMPDHADGLAEHEPEHGRPEGVVGVAVGVPTQGGGVLPEVGRGRDLVLRLADRLAALERLDIGEVVRDPRGCLGDAGEDARTLDARHPRPRALVERPAGGRHGRVEVLDAARWVATDDEVMGRALALERWPVRAPTHRPSMRFW